MTVLKNGEHTEFISENGRKYYVFNIWGIMEVYNRSNKKVRATEEIKANIQLA